MNATSETARALNASTLARESSDIRTGGALAAVGASCDARFEETAADERLRVITGASVSAKIDGSAYCIVSKVESRMQILFRKVDCFINECYEHTVLSMYLVMMNFRSSTPLRGRTNPWGSDCS